MKKNLMFDFRVDKSSNQIFVTRESAADEALVWKAFTTKELLDQWWAPKPWLSRTKRMDFEEGGRRFYAMVSPEGQEHWSIQDFTSIAPGTSFKFFDAFADKDENVTTELPSSEWDLNFSAEDGTTTVKIVIQHQSLSDLEQIIQMGFQEGFTMTLSELDTILNNLKS